MSNTTTERIRHNVLPVLTAFIWGTAFVSQDLMSRHLGAFAVNMARSAVAVVFLFLVSLGMDLYRKKKSGLSAASEGTAAGQTGAEKAETEKAKKSSRRQLWVGGLICGTILAGAVVLQQAGIARSGAGKAGFLTALYVVLVPVLGILRKKKVPKTVWIAVLLALFGLYFLCIKAGTGFTVSSGDWLLIGCALAFSVQIMLVDKLAPNVDNIKLSCIQFLACMVWCLIGMLVFEHPHLSDFTACIWPILYCGVFSSGIAYTLQIVSQKGANPAVVSILLSLESVFATLSAAVYLHEILSAREYVGCALMFAAVVLSQLPGRVRTKQQKQTKQQKRIKSEKTGTEPESTNKEEETLQ